MKKHLIAAAVAAAVAVPAAAQVTISGTLDTGYATRDVKAAGVSTKTSETGFATRGATSTINFTAQEDLGGGLKATGFINQSLTQTTGAMGARDIWTSVAGGFGEVKIGRFTPAFESVTGGFNITGTTNSAGTADFMYGSAVASTSAFGPDTAYSDVGRGLGAASGSTIQYSTPSMNGAKLVVGMGKHSLDDAATAGKRETDQLDVAVSYGSGPLSVGFAVVQRKDSSSAPAVSSTATEGTASQDIDMTGLGVSYQVGSMTLRAGILTREQKLSTATAKAVDATVNSVGLTMPFGANTLMVNYYDGDDDADGAAANKRSFSGYQVGAYHTLSKRTSVYALYGTDEKKAPTITNTHERTDVTIGVRHNF